MKIVITKTASDSLWPIYLYHLEYSQDYADQFQHEIDHFMLENLRDNPQLGHLFHEERGIRRLIFRKRFNIYYTVQEDTVFILFVFDGRMDINSLLRDQGLDTRAQIDE